MSRSELDAWAAVVNQSGVLSDFLDWLHEQGGAIEWSPNSALATKRPQEWIYAYLGIDPIKLEAERRALLEEQRRLNGT